MSKIAAILTKNYVYNPDTGIIILRFNLDLGHGDENYNLMELEDAFYEARETLSGEIFEAKKVFQAEVYPLTRDALVCVVGYRLNIMRAYQVDRYFLTPEMAQTHTSQLKNYTRTFVG